MNRGLTKHWPSEGQFVSSSRNNHFSDGCVANYSHIPEQKTPE